MSARRAVDVDRSLRAVGVGDDDVVEQLNVSSACVALGNDRPSPRALVGEPVERDFSVIPMPNGQRKLRARMSREMILILGLAVAEGIGKSLDVDPATGTAGWI